MKIRFNFFLLILIYSCSSGNIPDEKLQFNESGEFTYFDLNSMNEDSVLVFKKYTFMKGELLNSNGKIMIFLIDFNDNKSFNDKEDIIIFRDFNQKEPKTFSLDNDLKSNLIFSINETVYSIDRVFRKNNSYNLIYKVKDEKITNVKKSNRLINKISEVNVSLLDNEEINLSLFKNDGKLLYIDFWTTTCTPCIASIPDLKKMNEEFGDRIEVLSINSDKKSNIRKVQSIVDKYQMIWKVGLTNEEVKKNMDFNIYPKGYLFDEKGNLISSDIAPIKVLTLLKDNKI